MILQVTQQIYDRANVKFQMYLIQPPYQWIEKEQNVAGRLGLVFAKYKPRQADSMMEYHRRTLVSGMGSRLVKLLN